MVISTWSFGATAVEVGWNLVQHGQSALDTVERATNAVENDPSIDSVGIGGLPDSQGEVVLDAAIMESPTRWGSVLAVRGIKNPVSLARRILERYGRGVRVGSGAESLALEEGFIFEDLLTEASRRWWERMRETSSTLGEHPRFLDAQDGSLFSTLEPPACHDTIGTVVLDPQGCLAAATSTSGLPLKPAGRIGDSGIIGHGLFVEQGVGAVVATGSGELISSGLLAGRAIDALRSTRDISTSLRMSLTRTAGLADPHANDQAALVCLARDGSYGAAALRPGFRYTVGSEEGIRIEEPTFVLLGA